MHLPCKKHHYLSSEQNRFFEFSQYASQCLIYYFESFENFKGKTIEKQEIEVSLTVKINYFP